MKQGEFNQRMLKYKERVKQLRAEAEAEFGMDEKLSPPQERRIDGLIEALFDAESYINR